MLFRSIVVGKAEGKAEDILQLLEDLGEIPDRVKERIQKEADLQVLNRWLKAAARAESFVEFENSM